VIIRESGCFPSLRVQKYEEKIERKGGERERGRGRGRERENHTHYYQRKLQLYLLTGNGKHNVINGV